MKSIKAIVSTLFILFSTIVYGGESSRFLVAKSDQNWQSHFLLAEAQFCRPSDALPSGSYQESCRNCEVKGCNWLVCTCDGNKASANLSKCPQDNYCNNKGKLQCGEC